MPRSRSLATRLYRGEASYDFIGRRRIWYAVSGVLILISLGSLLVRGVHLGIEFKGGAVFGPVSANGRTVAEVRDAVTGAGVGEANVQKVGEGKIQVQTGSLPTAKTTQVQQVVAKELGVPTDSVAVSTVGPSWGGQITRQALLSLGIFLVAVIAYLSIRYEPKMALAAFVALVHDIVITAGIYSLVGFEVTPATVIALLTILGYSLYDTVVVFDKVRENTAGLAGGSRMTYTQAANLALNQTLVRSINTSIIALLPVGSLLFVGAGLLRAGTLKDLALALFIGLASGAYSSIFIATPLLADLKEREPAMRQLARRVAARQTAAPRTPAPAVAGSSATAGSVMVDPGFDPESVADSLPEPGLRPTPGRPAYAARAAQRPPARRGKPGRPSGKRRR